MAADPHLLGRIRLALERRAAAAQAAAAALPGPGESIVEKRMFGGVSFLLRGNMVCGVVDNLLCLRLGEARAQAALNRPHTRPMDFTGKPLRSMLYVEPEGLRTARSLEAWIGQALAFAATLPAKASAPRPSPRRRTRIPARAAPRS